MEKEGKKCERRRKQLVRPKDGMVEKCELRRRRRSGNMRKRRKKRRRRNEEKRGWEGRSVCQVIQWPAPRHCAEMVHGTFVTKEEWLMGTLKDINIPH